jgi:hypothetical protein
MSLSRQVVRLAPLLAVLVFTHITARAQPASPSGGCQASQGSLALLGCSLAQKLGPAALGAGVTVVELKSDRELPAPGALSERVLHVVANAIVGGGASPKPTERSKLRVELRIEKSGGTLRVSAELRRATGLWQRILHNKPRAELRAFVEVPLDAELRSLIPPPPLVVAQTLKIKAPERGIVALACGPLGSEGGQELALVSRSSVRVGHIAGRVFVERKRAAWSALSPVAAAPLREPIANAEITPEGTLRVGLTDRRDGVELSSELAVMQRFEARLPVAGGCAARSELGLSVGLEPCGTRGEVARAPATSFDAVAGAGHGAVGRELGSARLLGALSDPQSRLESPLPAGRVGAQLALGDADSDGAPELAYSSDTLEAPKDRLVLVTLEAKKPIARFELAAPGIAAIAICNRREGPGMAPIVLAVGDELWLLR